MRAAVAGAQLRAQAVVVLKRAGDEELGQYLLQARAPSSTPTLHKRLSTAASLVRRS